MTSLSDDPLALAKGVTALTNQLAAGLETGVAELYGYVTPVTAEMLHWWFGKEACAMRRWNFHVGQRQAILNTIVAHEVVGASTLLDLYMKAAVGALSDVRLSEVVQQKHRYPKYCLTMATGTGKTWVLQALLIWQWLNKSTALEECIDHLRFTNRFLLVASGPIQYQRWLDAFCGTWQDGERDFATSDVAQHADLFLPAPYREQVFDFMRNEVCLQAEIGLKANSDSWIGIANAKLPDQEGFLDGLPELMVFNGEMHPIRGAEWQKSLSRIAANKGQRFMQLDFSTMPHDGTASETGREQRYFPHIIANFDLKSAMRAGLVKTPVLDRQPEVVALSEIARVEQDAESNPVLSQEHRVMLRIGLQKQRMLERDFSALDVKRHPKMLVVCEDIGVTHLVEQFLYEEGLHVDEVFNVECEKRSELEARFFDAARHSSARVIISSLLSQYGLGIGDICIAVPLRSSSAPLSVEQTIGLGMRLMWRDEEFADIKRENRERMQQGIESISLLDVLLLVEHPAFQSRYEDWIAEGLLGVSSGASEVSSVGDMMRVDLRENFEEFDFAIPVVVQDADTQVMHGALNIAQLPPFPGLAQDALAFLSGSDKRRLRGNTPFGDYLVDGTLMQVDGYQDLLSRLAQRIAHAFGMPFAPMTSAPSAQVNVAGLRGELDRYIRERLFDDGFDPLQEESWRLLLLQPVFHHVARVFADALADSETGLPVRAQMEQRKLSDVPALIMRESSSLPVAKCIYERLPLSPRHGVMQRQFIEWAQADSHIRAFCKIGDTRHEFPRFRYIKDDGMPAVCQPDFIVRTGLAVYLVETTAQNQLAHADVRRKLKAARSWCGRINRLDGKYRQYLPWHYVLLGDEVFNAWRLEGVHLAELLVFARLGPLDMELPQENPNPA